ncbi:MAG: histidine--tRNA ligase, partial [Lentisphaerae bacterium]|nr:histidine--tRNA ligase [Lentisphaerota bacterium]
DFYPAEMHWRNTIFAAWRQAAGQFGFNQYDACVVESLELLQRKSGPEIVEQIYAFQDKSGRALALRPEITPTLARMIAARQAALQWPLKWFAIAQCFRYERMSRGRKREHYQWNLDIVGEPALSAEAELLACALHALNLLGLDESAVQVYYNHRDLLADLLQQAGIEASQQPAVLRALDKRGKISEEAIADLLSAAGLKAAQIKSVLGIIALQSPAAAAQRLGRSTPALEELEALPRLLAHYGLADRLRFDIGVVRGLDYYTGMVFEAFDAERKLRALFGGGRYDRLLADIGGQPLPAVGLGFGDVVIAELLAAKGLTAQARLAPDMVIGFMGIEQQATAIQIGQALRRGGQSVGVALHPEKPKHFFARSGPGARRAIYLGPDDLARGTGRIKDLAARSEQEVSLAQLLAGQKCF